MQIGAQMTRTVISHLKHFLNTSKLQVEMAIKKKWDIFFKVRQLRQNCNREMQIEMRDGTVEHFPVRRPVERHRVDGAPLDVGVEDPLPGVVEGQPDGVLHKVSGNTISDQQFLPL